MLLRTCNQYFDMLYECVQVLRVTARVCYSMNETIAEDFRPIFLQN